MIILPTVILAMPEGDDRAYMEWLYKQHHRLMFSIAWKAARDRALIDDIVSESCLALIRNVSTLRTLERGQLRAYIVSTVKNTTLNLACKQQRLDAHVASEEVQAVADDCDVAKQVELEAELECVWNAIMQLPEKERQIMRMKYLMNMLDDDIAQAVGLSESSIRKYIGRAREHIKAIVYVE